MELAIPNIYVKWNHVFQIDKTSKIIKNIKRTGEDDLTGRSHRVFRSGGPKKTD